MDGLMPRRKLGVDARMSERISLNDLTIVIERLLAAVEVPPDEAVVVAASLVAAEARGLSSHGVNRLETYLKRVKRGLIRVGVAPQVIAETPAVVVLDALSGFGHVAGIRA